MKQAIQDAITSSSNVDDVIQKEGGRLNIGGTKCKEIYSQVLIENKKEKRKEKISEIKGKVSKYVWGAAIIGIILQIIFWGWWTILSGIATIIVALVIYNILDD